MTAFVAQDGMAQWRRILSEVIELQPGEVVTHERLRDACGDWYFPGHVALQRAAQELRVNHQRSLVSVRGVGYRVIHPHEHIATSERAVRRSRRAMRRAHEEIASADRSQLTVTERRVADGRELALARMMSEVQRETRLAAIARREVDAGRAAS